MAVDGKTMDTVRYFIFLGSPKSLQMMTAAMKVKDTCSLKEKLWQHIKKQRRYFATKVCPVKAMVFPVVKCGCESQTIKKAECQKIDSFELWCWRRLLRVPWTARRSSQSKGNQSWIFIGRTDAEAEAPILWSSDSKSWLIGKDPDAGKDWRQEEQGMTEDEMVGWHHRLHGHEFEQAPGVGDGLGSLSAGVHRVAKSWTRLSDWTELDWMGLLLDWLNRILAEGKPGW